MFLGALLFALMAGCNTLPIDFDANSVDDVLNSWSCGRSSDEKACMQDYVDDTGLRLLRGHLVVAVAARYGAERLEEYSEDIVHDATKLLGRIESAQTELQRAFLIATARSDKKIEGLFYPVNRVDALLAVVETVDMATRPTRRGLFGFAVLSSPTDRIRDAPDILKRALRNQLYSDAYWQSLENLRAELRARPAGLAGAWLAIDAQLEASCARLADYAKLKAHQCLSQRGDLTKYLTKAATKR